MMFVKLTAAALIGAGITAATTGLAGAATEAPFGDVNATPTAVDTPEPIVNPVTAIDVARYELPGLPETSWEEQAVLRASTGAVAGAVVGGVMGGVIGFVVPASTVVGIIATPVTVPLGIAGGALVGAGFGALAGVGSIGEDCHVGGLGYYHCH